MMPGATIVVNETENTTTMVSRYEAGRPVFPFFRFFRHRARTACRAISLRSSGGTPSHRALPPLGPPFLPPLEPPFMPPLRPNATA